jgi:hypothetical protein
LAGLQSRIRSLQPEVYISEPRVALTSILCPFRLALDEQQLQGTLQRSRELLLKNV